MRKMVKTNSLVADRVSVASRIAEELKKAKQCGIYEPELSRAWPTTGTSRKAKIAYFAKRYGWRLRHYKEGFCAIFDKGPAADRSVSDPQSAATFNTDNE